MAMNSSYLNAIGDHGASLITHIALVDSSGSEVGDSRKSVSWTTASDGLVRPDADIEFNMTAGEEVAGWRGYSSSSGGTNYGGASLSQVTFGNDGIYTLIASATGIDHNAV